MKVKLIMLFSVLVLGAALTACGDVQETQAETVQIPEDAEFWDAPETAPVDIGPDPALAEPVQETAAFTPETAPAVNP